MPSLSSHHSSATTKLLLIGDSGGGKTGALASLAQADYNLRIIDCDNGIDILANLLKGTPAIERVIYETVTEKMRINPQGKPEVAGIADAWPRATRLLTRWKTEDGDLGPLESWTSKDVLVIDSLTMFSRWAMNAILQLNKRLNEAPWQSDWGEAQKLVEDVLALLYSDAVPCNVIVNCHITYIGRQIESLDDKGKVVTREEDVRAYPLSLGRALSPKIGRYFNNALLARSLGGTRALYTNTQGLVELKTAAPRSVKSSYPIETGLAKFFADVQS